MENMIIARFKDNETAAETDRLRQWDYGQTLRIEGLSLPDMVEVHFSIRDVGGDAERQIGTTKDGVTEVSIPDKMLENKHCKCSEYTIYAWVYLSDETSGQTEYDIRIPVETRSRPVDFAPPNQPDFAGKVMEKLNDVETLKADFDGLKKESDERDKQKLTRPEGAKAGQIFKVQAVNEDGTLVLEAVDMPKCDVTDVQINGQSIVNEGVAEIPTIKRGKFGLPFIDAKESDREINGIDVDDRFGNIKVIPAKLFRIDGRSTNTVITPNNFDYAVKCAMCDGKGAAWTEEEQAAARARMGIYSNFELINSVVIEEEASTIIFDTTDNGDAYDFSDAEIILNLPAISVIDLTVNFNKQEQYYPMIYRTVGNSSYETFYRFRTLNNGNKFLAISSYHTNSINNPSTNTVVSSINQSDFDGHIKIIRFYTDAQIPIGTKIEIYGKR